MIVRCSEGGAPFVAGYAAVRQDHIEFRPLQGCKERITAIDRQDVAIESAARERQAHQLGIRSVVFQMQYPQLHVPLPRSVVTNTQDYGYSPLNAPSNLQHAM